MASKGWISYPVTNSPQHVCNNCTRVFESISLYENLGYSTSTVKGYGRQCSWGGQWRHALRWCSTVVFRNIFDNSESVASFNTSLLGKNIEILLIFIKPLQYCRQLQTSRLALILMKLMIRLRQFKYQKLLIETIKSNYGYCKHCQCTHSLTT